MQTGDMSKFQHYVFTQTTLSVGESVHGLGERFGAFNKVVWTNAFPALKSLGKIFKLPLLLLGQHDTEIATRRLTSSY